MSETSLHRFRLYLEIVKRVDYNVPPIAAMHDGTVFSILVNVQLYTVMSMVCHWLTNEKQRKTDIHLTDQ